VGEGKMETSEKRPEFVAAPNFVEISIRQGHGSNKRNKTRST